MVLILDVSFECGKHMVLYGNYRKDYDSKKWKQSNYVMFGNVQWFYFMIESSC